MKVNYVGNIYAGGIEPMGCFINIGCEENNCKRNNKNCSVKTKEPCASKGNDSPCTSKGNTCDSKDYIGGPCRSKIGREHPCRGYAHGPCPPQATLWSV